MLLEPVYVVGPSLACRPILGCSLGSALVGLGLGPKMGLELGPRAQQQKQKNVIII